GAALRRTIIGRSMIFNMTSIALTLEGERGPLGPRGPMAATRYEVPSPTSVKTKFSGWLRHEKSVDLPLQSTQHDGADGLDRQDAEHGGHRHQVVRDETTSVVARDASSERAFLTDCSAGRDGPDRFDPSIADPVDLIDHVAHHAAVVRNDVDHVTDGRPLATRREVHDAVLLGQVRDGRV